jgi:hypothetical protein
MKDVWTLMDMKLEPPVEKPFREYAETYFNLNRKGMLRKRTTVEKILNFKPVCGTVHLQSLFRPRPPPPSPCSPRCPFVALLPGPH